MLKLTDLRKTTRRVGEGDLRQVYPRVLRDRALAPKIELAIRYMERMLGHTRAELDDEVIVQLFGDHKLARCVVACLAASYRHVPRTFVETLTEPRANALAAQGVADASALRLWLFARANADGAGFVGGAQRVEFLRAAAAELGLTSAEIELLMTLDAPANAILVRLGPPPSADDILARFNQQTSTVLLANATVVRLKLTRAVPDGEPIRALCALANVRAELGAREFVLYGQRDALDSLARHGAKLAATVSDLLASGLPVRSGEALIAAPNGGEWLYRMDADVMASLGGCAMEDSVCAPRALAETRQRLTNFIGDAAALRRLGQFDGWRVRRLFSPLAVAEGVWPVVLVGDRGRQRVYFIPLPPSAEQVDRVATLAARVPLLALVGGDEEIAAPIHAAARAADLPMLQYTSRADLLGLPTLLRQASARVEAHESQARLDALLREVDSVGVLTEQQLAERLHCDEEALPTRLAEPRLRAALNGRQLRYVEGFGLCAPEMLARARAASADVAYLRGTSAVGSAWLIRVLGRKLREVTGASEGIECLIAYLGAA